MRAELLTWENVYRLVVGYAMFPVLGVIAGSDHSESVRLLWFIAVLLGMRIIPMIARKLVPFSEETQRRWSAQRQTGKENDSYQWQKLMWLGLGSSAYIVQSNDYRRTVVGIAIFCLFTGVLGALTWHRSRMSRDVDRQITG